MISDNAKNEIVAILVDNIITNERDKNLLITLIEASSNAILLSRAHMRFIENCDLGQKWEDLANASTLFTVSDSLAEANLREAKELLNDN